MDNDAHATNLIESTEGFSRLIIYIFNDHVSSNTEGLENLIGTFDLTPARVVSLFLDIIDCAETDSLIRDHLFKSLRVLFQKISQQDVMSFPQNNSHLASLLNFYLKPLDTEGLDKESRKKLSSHIERLISDMSKHTYMLKQLAKQDYTGAHLEGVLETLLTPKDMDRAQMLFANARREFLFSSNVEVSKRLSVFLKEDIVDEYYKGVYGAYKTERSKSSCANVLASMSHSSDNHLKFFPTRIAPFIYNLSAFLYRNEVLFCKICRLLRRCLVDNPDTRVESQVLDIIRVTIIPAYSLIPNPDDRAKQFNLPGESQSISSSFAFWELIHAFKCEIRYQLYGWWLHTVYDVIPELRAMREKAVDGIAKNMRRLTVDLDDKLHRDMTKIVVRNPAVALDKMLESIQEYITRGQDKIAHQLFETFREKGGLISDVLSFLLLRRYLAATKPNKTDHPSTISQRLKSLSALFGKFFEIFANRVDLTAWLEFIYTQILHNRLGGYDILLNLISTTHKCSEDTRKALVMMFLQNHFIPPILVLLSRDIGMVPIDTFGELATFTRDQWDVVHKSHEAYHKIRKLLFITLGTDELCQKLLPSFSVLTTRYGLEPTTGYAYVNPKLRIEKKDPEVHQRCACFSPATIKAMSDIIKPLTDAPPYSMFNSAFWSLSPADIYSATAKNCCLNPNILENINYLNNKLSQEKQEELHKKFGDLNSASSSRIHVTHKGIPKSGFESEFLKNCIMPRMKISHKDAEFCAHMIQIMHKIEVPGFNIFTLFHKFFGQFGYLLTSCSDDEMKSVGVFMKVSLAWMHCVLRQKLCWERFSSNPYVKGLTHKMFGRVVVKWHDMMLNAIVSIHDIANGLGGWRVVNIVQVLSMTDTQFPRLIRHVEALKNWIESWKEEAKTRELTSVLSQITTYYNALTSIKTVTEEAFWA